jgi:hypothetical protein
MGEWRMIRATENRRNWKEICCSANWAITNLALMNPMLNQKMNSRKVFLFSQEQFFLSFVFFILISYTARDYARQNGKQAICTPMGRRPSAVLEIALLLPLHAHRT